MALGLDDLFNRRLSLCVSRSMAGLARFARSPAILFRDSALPPLLHIIYAGPLATADHSAMATKVGAAARGEKARTLGNQATVNLSSRKQRDGSLGTWH
jgi:hypothetical protein